MSFLFIFASIMLLDFITIEMSRLIVIHHLVCLLGHSLAAFAFPEGFPWYFAGAVSFEIGTGFWNLNDAIAWKYGKNNFDYLNVVIMTLSNIGALMAMRKSISDMRKYSTKTKCFCAALTVGLAFMREKEAIQRVSLNHF